MTTPRTVLVAGLHRSGTSALAGLLSHFGIPMGPQAPPEASAPPSNPLGQFEDQEFVELCNRVLGDWRNVSPAWLMQASEELPALEAWIANRNRQHTVWGVKTPQLCYLLPWVLYPEHLRRPLVLVSSRPFDDCVQSLCARDRYPAPVATAILTDHYRNLYSGIAWAQQHKVSVKLVSYQQLLALPAFTANMIHRAIFDEDAPQPLIDTLASVIDPTLCHSAPL